MLRLQSAGITSVVHVGGESVQVADDVMSELGGVIVNPLAARDQGLPTAESLYVNLTGPASVGVSTTDVEIVPGQWFLVPPQSNVWVNAASLGHKFTAFFSTSYVVPPAQPVPGDPASDIPGAGAEPGTQNFPPRYVTGMTDVLPSYLYQQYTDDEDLQGFVEAQNIRQQDYVDTFNALNLPIYTGPLVANRLLDWVGRGVYGMSRPVLGSGRSNLMGPLNTYGCNWLVPMWQPISQDVEAAFGYNMIYLYGPMDMYITDDDTYRRILSWHFFKQDGKYCSVSWLKRRVWRFIWGLDGKHYDFLDPSTGQAHPDPAWPGIDSDPDDIFIADKRQISVTFGVNRNVTIRFVLYDRPVNKPASGSILNCFGCNGFQPAWGIAPRPPNANGSGGAWDIGVDHTPSGGGANWQFNSPVTSGIGNSTGTTTLTISGVSSSGPKIAAGMSVLGTGVPPGTAIQFQISGPAGYNGVYQTTIPTNLSAAPITFGTNEWSNIGGGGATVAPGGIYMNEIETSFERYPPLPFMSQFKQALDLGVIELPYQFNYTCHIG